MPAAAMVVALLLGCRSEERAIEIATTTSVDATGLLQAMGTEFKRSTGITLNAFVVGSGRALRMAEEGKVDVTITHDPDAERALVARQKPAIYRQFMWNDFIIVGPAGDPAHVSSALSAVDALRRVHQSGSTFLSRHDQSGTHMKELSLWRAVGVTPESNPRYMPMGQPMAHLLRSADELQGYTLSDRATYDRLASSLHLKLLYAGDAQLRNVYAVTLMKRSASGEYSDARQFVAWLLSPEGRRLVESFEIGGRRELHWLGD
jgi:tungstate transport system substrate-binding protein